MVVVEVGVDVVVVVLPLSWPYVGPCGPMLALSWPYVGPPWPMLAL